MSTNQHPFTFDINFSFGTESVVSDMNYQGPADAPIPPEKGYFLELQTGPFILLNTQDMTLL